MQAGTCSHQDRGCVATGLAQVTAGARQQQQGVPRVGLPGQSPLHGVTVLLR